MKKIAIVVSIIAIANLIAMAGFAGWLVKSDRLDMDRLRRARVSLAKTITQERDENAAAKAKAESDEKAQIAAKLAAKPPLTAAERLSARVEANELDSQRAERLKREVQDMQRQLNDERAKLVNERGVLEADKKAFD